MRRSVGLLLGGFTLLAIGCKQPASREHVGTVVPKHGPLELWTNLGGEPEYIDPGKCTEAVGGDVIQQTFAGLVQAHPTTQTPMPDIARSWTTTDGGRRYLFRLRESGWSDGRPLTAHDFVYSWKRILDPATASRYVSFLFPVENAEAFARRAVWLQGVPADATQEAVGHAVAQRGRVKVEKVKLQPERGWAFVWVAEGLDAAATARLVGSLSNLRIAGRPVTARIADGRVVGVTALADDLLEVRLEIPLPYFLGLITHYTAMPVPAHVIERLRAEGKNLDLWTRPEYFVSNGAYTLREWRFRQHMTLTRNPHYWDAGNVRIERVRYRMIQDENTTLNFYLAGEIDHIGAQGHLPPEFLDHLRRFRDFRSDPYLGAYFYIFNVKAPPVDDLRVRQALSLSIDRAAITRYVSRGGEIPMASIVPDGLAGYRSPKAPLFDPERARELLAQAGYGPGHPFPALTLVYNTRENHRLIAEAMAEMWKRHLGIDVTLENQEWKVYLKTIADQDFQIARRGWIGDYPDPYTFLELFTADNGNNHTGWADPEYDALLLKANLTGDPAQRLALLAEAEERLLAAAAALPLHLYSRNQLVKPYIRGFYPDISNRPRIKTWWIDPRYTDGLPADPGVDPPLPLLTPEPFGRLPDAP